MGLARAQHDVVHRHPTYAVEVDTGRLDPEAAADAVAKAVAR
jgi:chloramphenicol 3-O-phosphotransferase